VIGAANSLGYPPLQVLDGCDEYVVEQRAKELCVSDADVDVTGLDLDAPDGEGGAAIKPPVQSTPIDAPKELEQGGFPRNLDEAGTLQHHLLDRAREALVVAWTLDENRNQRVAKRSSPILR
jgi:hypothetical protein